MSNSKIIIVEGSQGVGKTTITDFLRESIKHTNLYRLSGTSDSTPAGLKKAKNMYENLLSYMKTLENQNINLLFDRTFFSEENYCRLGFKEYSFTEVYKELVKKLDELDFEIYYITLYLKDESLFLKRLQREGKAVVSYAKFDVQSSIDQQNVYLQMADEIEQNYNNIKVCRIETGKDFKLTKEELKEIIGF